MHLVHPLQEVIDSEISQKEAATRLGISPQYLCDLIQKRRSAGAKVALRVQLAFGVDAMSILIRQAAHDLARELEKQPNKTMMAIGSEPARKLKAWRKKKSEAIKETK